MPVNTPAKSEKPFSDAAKRFQKKVNKFSMGSKVIKKKPNTRQVKPFPPMKSKLTKNIRTTSISHIEASNKESEEEQEMHHDNVLY